MGEGGKPKNKLVLLGLVGLVVLGGGGFLGYKFLKGRGHAAPAAPPAAEGKAEAAKEGHGEAAAEKDDAPVSVMVLKPFPINLQGKRNAYLKVELHLLIRDPDLAKAATSDKPTPENSMIRALILDLLSGRSAEEVTDPETKESVRLQIKDKLNESFEHWTPAGGEHGKKEKSAGKPVKDVLIVEWAHQI